ncbi:MAG: hypothetical protein AABZ57_05055, partial [Candidatus Margulisiibacteriota bacterium]
MVDTEKTRIEFDWRTISKEAKPNRESEDAMLLDVTYDCGEYGKQVKQIPASIYMAQEPGGFDAVESIEIETFDQKVGEMPYVRYNYQFETQAEAEKFSRKLTGTEDGNPMAIPVHARLAEDGLTTVYSVYTFGFAGSDMRVPDFDAELVNKRDIRLIKNGDVLQLEVRAQKATTNLLKLPQLTRFLDKKSCQDGSVRMTGLVGKSEREVLKIAGKSLTRTVGDLGLWIGNEFFDPQLPIPSEANRAVVEEDENHAKFLRFYQGETKVGSSHLPIRLKDSSVGEVCKTGRIEEDCRIGVQTNNQFIPLPFTPISGGSVEAVKDGDRTMLYYKDKGGNLKFKTECPADIAALGAGALAVSRGDNILYAETENGISSWGIGSKLPCKASSIIEVVSIDGKTEILEKQAKISFTAEALSNIPDP